MSKPLYYKIGDKLILAPDAPPVSEIISSPMPAAPTIAKGPPLPKCSDPLCRAPFTPNKGGASAKLCAKCYQHRRRANGRGDTDPGPAPSLIAPKPPTRPPSSKPPIAPDASSNQRRSAPTTPANSHDSDPSNAIFMTPAEVQAYLREKGIQVSSKKAPTAQPRPSAKPQQTSTDGEFLSCEPCGAPTSFRRKRSPGNITRCERCRKHFARYQVEYPHHQ